MNADQHLIAAQLLLDPEPDTPEETVTQYGILAAAHALTGILLLMRNGGRD